MMMYYLRDPVTHEITTTNDTMAWARNFESRSAHILKQETINGLFVSTVFLGIDHSWGNGPSVLWETMIFGNADDERDQYQERYTSEEDALRGHALVVAAIERGGGFYDQLEAGDESDGPDEYPEKLGRSGAALE